MWLDVLVGFLAVVAGTVANALTGFGKSIPHTALPCPALIQDGELSPTLT